jgi:hypothetical protein
MVAEEQRAVIKFLCCGNETVGNIHKRLKNVHGDDAVDRSTVGMPIFGILLAPAHRETPDNVQRVNDMILEDKRD